MADRTGSRKQSSRCGKEHRAGSRATYQSRKNGFEWYLESTGLNLLHTCQKKGWPLLQLDMRYLENGPVEYFRTCTSEQLIWFCHSFSDCVMTHSIIRNTVFVLNRRAAQKFSGQKCSFIKTKAFQRNMLILAD